MYRQVSRPTAMGAPPLGLSGAVDGRGRRAVPELGSRRRGQARRRPRCHPRRCGRAREFFFTKYLGDMPTASADSPGPIWQVAKYVSSSRKVPEILRALRHVAGRRRSASAMAREEVSCARVVIMLTAVEATMHARVDARGRRTNDDEHERVAVTDTLLF